MVFNGLFDVDIRLTKTGHDVIDLDGEGGLVPYNVTYDMTNKDGVGVTVLRHNSENRITEDNCKSSGYY